ncbi:hypothetical protein VTL71DRAFT_10342 [Oculimacula yallundae]|uniref:Uncharacterized protein n=1 Tax=Oculimacula yallundae TaxID=86028 RepID=A0ABR4CTC0_9HELO
MADQYGRDIREARELSVPQQAQENISTIPAIIEGQLPDTIKQIPSLRPMLTSASQKFLTERTYNPIAFKIWINIGIAKARSDYKATEKAVRDPAMTTSRRIFECLDAATEKNLDRIADKESAWKLLEACDWEDGTNDKIADRSDRRSQKQEKKSEAMRSHQAREEWRWADKDVSKMESASYIEVKERMEKADREDRRLRAENARIQVEQDEEVKLDEDNLP